MAEKNIQMKQRNEVNTAWDDLYPKTKAENVKLQNSNNLEEEIIQINQNIENIDLSAENISTSNESNVQLEIDNLKSSVSDGKNKVATAITDVDRGKDSNGSDTFDKLSDDIRNIRKMATATSFETLLSGSVDSLEKFCIVEDTGKFYGLARDQDGNLYAGDGSSFTVKKIDLNGNIVWEHTGHTNTVYALALDHGYLYSGSADNTVHKIDISNGNLVWATAFASENVRSLAVDHERNIIFGSEDTNVYKCNSSGLLIGTYTGHLNRVYSVAVDKNGMIYCGGLEPEVHKVEMSSIVQLLNKYTYYQGLYSIAVDDDENIYTGVTGGMIEKRDKDDNTIFVTLTGSNTAYDLTFDPVGNIYGALNSTGYDGVVKLNKYGRLQWIIDDVMGDVYSIVLDDVGHIYAGENGEIYKIEQTEAKAIIYERVSFETNYVGYGNYIYAVAVDQEGNFYCGGAASDIEGIHKVDKEGNFLNKMGSFSGTVTGVKVDDHGNIFTSDYGPYIKKYDQDGMLIWSYRNTDINNGWLCLDIDSLGYVYAGDEIGDVVKLNGNLTDDDLEWRYTGHTDDCKGVAANTNGDCFTASRDNRVRKIDDNDGTLTWTFEGSGSYDFLAVVVDQSNGHEILYVGDSGNYLRRVSEDGGQVWFVNLGNDVTSLAVDQYGYIYAGTTGSSSNNAKLFKLDSDGNVMWIYGDLSTGDHVRSIAIYKNDTIYIGIYSADAGVRNLKLTAGIEM
ncbi:PQQ-binding-like beta-propeller repeat protein [Chengkuizengella sp. SCS-71B]|uniref:outer membrane protein assembly factor BamB family protein n=1 Tax=Chengkuizengella sp. SCS-71B TaxID=3115290 RepID=UPI0032C224F7